MPISAGRPLFFGTPCPDADYADKPSGYYCRMGAGLPPFAYEQDCDLLAEHRDRVRVVPFVTNAGVAVPVIRIEGDSPGRSGGALIQRPLSNPTSWAEGAGLRETVYFLLSDEIPSEPYCMFELRGELDLPNLQNEGYSALAVALRKDRLKIKYYRNAEDARGGGGRFEASLMFPFAYNVWYGLTKRLLAVPALPNTWEVKVKLHELARPDNKVVFRSLPEQGPTHIVSLRDMAIGDEQQGLGTGGTTYVSLDEDTRLPSALAAE